ncbi:UNVERIFIED_CONTAM: hypothetical protein FKN15_049372 [Acipenser sinensis]
MGRKRKTLNAYCAQYPDRWLKSPRQDEAGQSALHSSDFCATRYNSTSSTSSAGSSHDHITDQEKTPVVHGGRVLTECLAVQKHLREMVRGDCNSMPEGSSVYSGGEGPLCRNNSYATMRLQAVLVKAMPSQGRMKQHESYEYRLMTCCMCPLCVIMAGNVT